MGADHVRDMRLAEDDIYQKKYKKYARQKLPVGKFFLGIFFRFSAKA